jgi:hypothetical protein
MTEHLTPTQLKSVSNGKPSHEELLIGQLPIAPSESAAEEIKKADQEAQSLAERDAFLDSPGDGELLKDHMEKTERLLREIDGLLSSDPNISVEKLRKQLTEIDLELTKHVKNDPEDPRAQSARAIRRTVAEDMVRLDRLSYQLTSRPDFRREAPVKMWVDTHGGEEEGKEGEGSIVTFKANGQILVAVSVRKRVKYKPVTFEQLEEWNPRPSAAVQH